MEVKSIVGACARAGTEEKVRAIETADVSNTFSILTEI
jgi:hypothetical protein